MDRIDEQGRWELQEGVEILVEPSGLWITENTLVRSREERLTPLRAERDKRLDECDTRYCNADKWELMDEPTKTLWRAYKQALRDLPDLVTNEEIDNPTWPVMPGA